MIYLEHLCATADTVDQSLKRKKKRKTYYKINVNYFVKYHFYVN